MSQTEKLKTILQTYKFDHPIPAEVQKKMMKMKKDTLASILKKEKKYNLFTSTVISFFFWVKKFGISISMEKSQFLIRGASLAAVCMVVVTVGYSILRLSIVEPFLDRPVVTCKIGDIDIERSGEAARLLEIKDVLNKGDIIKTKDKSEASMQLGKGVIIHIQPNSIFNMVSLVKNEKSEIFLQKGQILSNIIKLKKGSEHIVKTENAIATVQGTAFSVSYEQGKSVIAVTNGKVHIQTFNRTASKIVNKGNTALIIDNDNIIIRPITKAEEQVIEKVTAQTIIEDVENKSRSDLEKMSDQFKIKMQGIDDKINSEFMSLKDIKQKYGRIDVITLYNGRKYKGIIISRKGKIYTILTPEGSLNLSMDQIKNTGVQ